MEAETREELERQKLKAEIASASATARDLSRADWSRPTFWIAVATAIVAVVGVLLQAYLSKNEYLLASVQKERAELDAKTAMGERDRLQAERDRLQIQQAILKGELERLDQVIKALSDRKVSVEGEVATLQQVRAGLSAAIPNVSQSTRFAPVDAGVDPNQFLRNILDGWWRGTSIRALHWVEQPDRRGWELTEGR